MFYKCLKKINFENGMIFNTDDVSYGKMSGIDPTPYKDTVEYMIDASLENDRPLILFFFIAGFVTHHDIEDGTIADVLQHIEDPTYPIIYKLSDLVDEEFLGGTIIRRRELRNYLNNAKKIKRCMTTGNIIWEYMSEKIRQEKFKELPPRLGSYFLFDSEENANNFKVNIHSDSCDDYIIVKADILECRNMVTLDMAIWDQDFNNISYRECEKQLINYWRSYENTQKLAEILVQGKIKLYC
jgi:hypothetical protein